MGTQARRPEFGSDQNKPDLQDLAREIGMIRLGLYEQGRRISVLAEQLRDEIKAIGRGGPHQ
jgi:hypothetical protein